NIALNASAACNGSNLAVSIGAGDGPFDITGAGTGLPATGVGAGTTPLSGPGSWTGVTVTETTGDLESMSLGDFTCGPSSVALSASAACNGNNLDVSIASGDAPFDIGGSGPGLPLGGVGAGTTPLAGPGSWTGVTVTETTGDLESMSLGDF